MNKWLKIRVVGVMTGLILSLNVGIQQTISFEDAMILHFANRH